MKINKSSILQILNRNGIPSKYIAKDFDCDAVYLLSGKFDGIEISFGSGSALVSKFDENDSMWDLVITDISKLISAIQSIASK
jgi:hypothetical protein